MRSVTSGTVVGKPTLLPEDVTGLARIAQVFTRMRSCQSADWTSRGVNPSTRVHIANSSADITWA